MTFPNTVPIFVTEFKKKKNLKKKYVVQSLFPICYSTNFCKRIKRN